MYHAVLLYGAFQHKDHLPRVAVQIAAGAVILRQAVGGVEFAYEFKQHNEFLFRQVKY